MSWSWPSFARMNAILVKEFIQMRRDRLTFAMMIAVPIMQLLLFGYAINLDPKGLHTALVDGDQSRFARVLISSLETSGYFHITERPASHEEGQAALAAGRVSFVITIPQGFGRDLMRGVRPQILIEADATDPAAASGAVGAIPVLADRALRHELTGPLATLLQGAPAIDAVIHRRYNPEGITAYNIVPGLLGVILTMTMVMMTAMSLTREVERGTMENLLAMPATPFEIMIGKITPYLAVGFVQVFIVLAAAKFLFSVPFIGSFVFLMLALLLYVMALLTLGFAFSTLARSQMQAMQLTFFFFLPSLLLSGFMFPFSGMPGWAQVIGETLPLTHFLRIIRGIMLKGIGPGDVIMDLWGIAAFLFVVGFIAMKRFRRTLD